MSSELPKPRHVPPLTTAEERRLNLLKDGGRLVMNGGDPYEDDLEPAGPEATGFRRARAKAHG